MPPARGYAQTVNCQPDTLEDVAFAGGWDKFNQPVPDSTLIDNETGGFRGEPGLDDDATELPYSVSDDSY